MELAEHLHDVFRRLVSGFVIFSLHFRLQEWLQMSQWSARSEEWKDELK
jgi:hypothetical protein